MPFMALAARVDDGGSPKIERKRPYERDTGSRRIFSPPTAAPETRSCAILAWVPTGITLQEHALAASLDPDSGLYQKTPRQHPIKSLTRSPG